MSNLQERVRRIELKERLIFASLASIITAISMPGMVSSVFVWFGLVPLFFALKDDRDFKLHVSFLLGWYFGILYMGLSMYWILPTLVKNIALFNNFPAIFGVLAFVMFAIIEGLFFGAFAFFYVLLQKKSKRVPWVIHMLSMAGIYIILEFLRGYGATGFTGSMLSEALYNEIGTLQIVSFVGGLGLTFLIFLSNYLIYRFLSKKNLKGLLMVLIVIAFSYVFSAFYPYMIKPDQGRKISIGVVQPNLSVSQRYSMSSEQIFKEVKWGITSLATKTKIIFFPEGTFEYEISGTSIYSNLKTLLKNENVHAIIGYPSSKNGKIYNSAGFFDENGLNEIYSKHILVPFTETLPYPQIFGIFGFLKLSEFFTPGNKFTVFNFDDLNFSTDICFESYFGWLSRKFTNEGAQFIVTITDDSWFDQKTALIQHFSQDVVRAVENRKWIIQVADTGITGSINPYGQIVDQLPIHQKIASIFDIYPNKVKTFYDMFGNLMLWLSIGFVILELIVIKSKK
ncbi:MAG: apolipoprotein N-acyltransferase [Thermotogae bacterium]|nr:apolipoprotein N-acyltransferase [Thermotogota bacterium]MCL5032753.1 apolipoprotein N-acyltransferase [Thermotogota bacterium]